MRKSAGFVGVVVVLVVLATVFSLVLVSGSGDWLVRLEIYFGKFPWVSIMVPLGIVVAFLVVSVARLNRRSSQTCPRCGGSIERMHRTRMDRLICVVLPQMRRYGCQDPYCGWTRLQRRKSS
jgi:hypothetical protein